MSKEIKFNAEAQAELMKGVKVIADAVKVTLGPSGRTVLIAGENVRY